MAEGIFPYIEPAATAAAATLPVAREMAWDFSADRAVFSGGEPVWVERAEAVKVWAWNALHTPRWRYEIYTADYGNDIENMIGSGWSDALKTAEAQQCITECLLASPYITAVRDLSVTFADGVLTASFVIDSIYGMIGMEVEQDV